MSAPDRTVLEERESDGKEGIFAINAGIISGLVTLYAAESKKKRDTQMQRLSSNAYR